MVWANAVMVPVTTGSAPPVPPALPMATTGWPTDRSDELPVVTVVSPETSWSWRRATSSVTE
jgi:hypothetical protein